MVETSISILIALALIAFGVFCGVMAAQIAYGNFQARRGARKSQAWPPCEGRVMSANLVHVGVRAGWKPTIIYAYTVDGVEHTSQRMTFDYIENYSRREAQSIMERYPVHAPVQVYFDPEQPQDASLSQTTQETGCGMFLLPFVLVLPTAFCIAAGWLGLVSAVK